MNTWHFRLRLDPQETDIDDAFDALHEAGCDDALFAHRDGAEYATFSRAAPTLEEAVFSAIADVERVGDIAVTAIWDESPVSLDEIAARSGRSVASVLGLIERTNDDVPFPNPLTWPDEDSQQWQWLKVRDWFADRLGEQLNDPNAAVFTALSDTLRARASCGKLNHDQQQRIAALLNG